MMPLRYVGFWKRLLATLIDVVALNIIISLICFPWTSGLPPLSFEPTSAVAQNYQAEDIQKLLQSFIIISIIASLAPGIYECLFTSSRLMATPGKWVLSMVVVDEKGQRITFARSVARHAGKAVSALLLFIGFFMVGWDKKKQGLHDKMAQTFVVERESLLNARLMKLMPASQVTDI